MTETVLCAAARNNAEWCHFVCQSHGLRSEFSSEAWTCATRPPRFYPDAVTLRLDTIPDHLLDRIEVGPGCSVKDSFAVLDLTSAGFEVLFDAEWIQRPGNLAPLSAAARDHWEALRDPPALRDWELAWSDDGVFLPHLLARSDVQVLAARRGGRIVAGAVLNRSDAVVGLSNLFSIADDLDGAWDGAVATAAALHPGLPIVGYERGENLAAAIRHGFEAVGPLRVWLRPGA
jgi:hypothetical protein